MKRLWSCFAVAVLWSALCAPAWAAPPVTYARLDLGQGEKSIVYLSFQNNKMKMAPTLAGLDKAAPTRAKDQQLDGSGGSRYQSYQFPERDLPLAAGDAKASATFTYTRSHYKRPGAKAASESLGVYGDLTLARRGSDGATWGYVFNIITEHQRPELGRSQDHPLTLSVPKAAPSKLTFEIVTKVEGRKARIGLQAKADESDISSILKNGKPAAVALEVTDRDGKAIVSEKGDLKKFGFT